MPRADDTLRTSQETKPNSVLRPRTLRHGTMVSADLVAARIFYEEFLGLDCTNIAFDRLLLRLVVQNTRPVITRRSLGP